MNKKGQTLVLFVILIPIVLGLSALVIDVGYIVKEEVKLKEVSKSIIRDVFDKGNEEEIREMFLENDMTVDNLEIFYDTDRIRIKNEEEIDSIFGKIIGIDSYQIKVDITGFKENDKVIFE